MPSVRVSKQFNSGAYFITLTVRRWYYLFDRQHRWNILADSLEYCRKNKGLKVFGFVFMLNHLHLIVYSPDVSGFIRDFKRFTSGEFRKNLEKTESAVLALFLNEEGKHEFWEKTNLPKIIESVSFFQNKLEYIHNNPIRKNYVMQAEAWYWSSANPLCEIKVDEME